MDILDEEILSLWKALFEEKVVYILVGGFATNLNGFQRTTADMDIWLKDTLPNRRNLIKALEKTGAPGLEALETPAFYSRLDVCFAPFRL
jgi:hypothetical protein